MASGLEQLSQLMQLKNMQDASKARGANLQYKMQQDALRTSQADRTFNALQEQRKIQNTMARRTAERLDSKSELDALVRKQSKEYKDVSTTNIPHLLEAYKGDRVGFLQEAGALAADYPGSPEKAIQEASTLYDKTYGAEASGSSRAYGGVSRVVGKTEEGDSIIFMPQANEGMGAYRIEKTPGGGKVDPLVDKPLPSEQIDFLEKADTLKDQISSISNIMGEDEEWKKWVGPVDARLGRMQDVTGLGADEKRSVFHATMQDIQNMIIYMRSGKQINESEYQRIRKAMPDIFESEVAFGAKWDKFMGTFSSVLDNREQRLRDQPGYKRSVGDTGVTPSTQPPAFSGGAGGIGAAPTDAQIDAALQEADGDIDKAMELIEQGRL